MVKVWSKETMVTEDDVQRRRWTGETMVSGDYSQRRHCTKPRTLREKEIVEANGHGPMWLTPFENREKWFSGHVPWPFVHRSFPSATCFGRSLLPIGLWAHNHLRPLSFASMISFVHSLLCPSSPRSIVSFVHSFLRPSSSLTVVSFCHSLVCP